MIQMIDCANNLKIGSRQMNAQAFIKEHTGGARYGVDVRMDELLKSSDQDELKKLIASTTNESSTARKVFKELGGSDEDDQCMIYIILVTNKFSAMNCVFSPVDTKKSQARVGVVPFKPNDTYSVKHAIFSGFRLAFPQSVVLFHELGHAVQWKTRQQWDAKQIDKGMNSQGFFEDLERDNLSKVEWPMCQELGVHVRRNYLDLEHRRSTLVEVNACTACRPDTRSRPVVSSPAT